MFKNNAAPAMTIKPQNKSKQQMIGVGGQQADVPVPLSSQEEFTTPMKDAYSQA